VLGPVLGLLVHLACGLDGDLGLQLRTSWPCRHATNVEKLARAEDDAHRFHVLPEAAKAAFEMGRTQDARHYAEEALRLAPQFRNQWSHGNAIHDGHMVLGRVALRENNVVAARTELLQAGRTRGSPNLNSFGPNVSLAKDLLERKQTDVVLQYFGLCARFWKFDRERLERWTVQVKAGEMPKLGGNLVY
jgi:hypothetical protein